MSVAYRRAGQGPPLVLLHGFLFDSRAWRPQLEELSSDFTVVAWDAPGAGRSPDPPESFALADWADCLASLLDAIDLRDPTSVVGLSWGAVLAQELYRRHPERVQSLVLAGAYAGWRGSLPAALVEERLAACLRDSRRAASDVVASYLPGMHSAAAPSEVRDEMAAIIADFHPVGFRLMARSLAETDTRDLLPEIRVPTLLVYGEADARASLSVGEAIRALIPGARLAVIPGAGHVSNLEAPERFNALVRDFSRPPAP
jgi:pimeloyl-ACP methyl ester carboxylesterase